jgi:hypothetical protein
MRGNGQENLQPLIEEADRLGLRLKELAREAGDVRGRLFPIVKRLNDAGMSLGRIASLTGFTRGRIHQIVHLEEPARRR